MSETGAQWRSVDRSSEAKKDVRAAASYEAGCGVVRDGGEDGRACHFVMRQR